MYFDHPQPSNLQNSSLHAKFKAGTRHTRLLGTIVYAVVVGVVGFAVSGDVKRRQRTGTDANKKRKDAAMMIIQFVPSP